ncbi:MAG: hypothetical protein FJ253_11495, partial [Phycisphaerae bacterium]|nr:hypothetical protein [Phycisphaerae bacterium]
MNRKTFTLASAALSHLAALSWGEVLPPPAVSELPALPGDALVGPARANQTQSVAARGDDSILVVWMDERSGLAGNGTAESGMDIFGIRLDADGNAVDPAPFAIAAGAGWQQLPAVSWNGANWLVTFYSQDPTQFYYVNNVRGVRVAPSGEVLDPTPILLAPEQQWIWTAGTDGIWLVTWLEPHPDLYGYFVQGRRLGNDGLWLDAAPRMIMDWAAPNRVLAAGG